jgi:hypothetical protein
VELEGAFLTIELAATGEVPALQHRRNGRPKWLVQACCGRWVFQFPFSCFCGCSAGCIRPSRIVWQRMNGIFYLVGLVVLALIVVYALKFF